MSDWEDALHRRIAAAIKRVRSEGTVHLNGFPHGGPRSAQWLADRTAALGYPISRAQIANYESGRKKGLDVAELLVLARALNTTPATLLFPGPYDAPVEVLPGVEVSELDAAQWFSGEEHAVFWYPGQFPEVCTPPEMFDFENRHAALEWLKHTRHLRKWRDIREAEQMRDWASQEEVADRDQVAFYEKQIQRMKQDLEEPD